MPLEGRRGRNRVVFRFTPTYATGVVPWRRIIYAQYNLSMTLLRSVVFSGHSRAI